MFRPARCRAAKRPSPAERNRAKPGAARQQRQRRDGAEPCDESVVPHSTLLHHGSFTWIARAVVMAVRLPARPSDVRSGARRFRPGGEPTVEGRNAPRREGPGALRGWASTVCSPRSTRESHSSPYARGRAARFACCDRASRARLPCASPRRRPSPSRRSYSPACQRLCNETRALTHLLPPACSRGVSRTSGGYLKRRRGLSGSAQAKGRAAIAGNVPG
jgi:hypothetical protein